MAFVAKPRIPAYPEPSPAEAGRLFPQRVNILGLLGHAVFVAASQLCDFHQDTDLDHLSMNGHGCVPIELTDADI